MEIYFTSDTHFGHEKAIPFCRPSFHSVEEMDELMIERWNAAVGKHDRVYHLGDFAWSTKRAKEVRPRLNGTIRLIVGNHDDIPSLCAAGLFQRVQFWRQFKEYGFTASHLPLPENLIRHGSLNVHGHEHDKGSPHPAYQLNVCVENWDYTPVHLDRVLEWVATRS